MTPIFKFFLEGITEEIVLTRLRISDLSEVKSASKGKKEIPKKIREVLGPILGNESLRCLIMRDIDPDDGETLRSIKQGIEGAFRLLFKERGYDQDVVILKHHNNHPNVYIFQSQDPNIRIAVHVATHRCLPTCTNSTIDDYVLELALRDAIAHALIERAKKKEENRIASRSRKHRATEKREWTITADKLIYKVRNEIPTLLSNNGIPTLKEAKDYVRFYAAVIQEHTSPPTFARIILANTPQEDMEDILSPLSAAVDFLREDLP